MKYTGWCQNDFNVQGYRHRVLPDAAVRAVEAVQVLHRRARLDVV
jgi:hypothetical protein